MKKTKLAFLGLILIIAAVTVSYLVSGNTVKIFANIALIAGIILAVKGFTPGVKENDKDTEEETQTGE